VSLEEASAVFDAGADKIAINSAAVRRPELITEIAGRFGSQAVVVAIDAKSDGDGGYQVYVSGGRRAVNRTAVEWAHEAEQHGAGEILLTSMDRDGTRAGFDCQLTAAIEASVSIPVIASGGAGCVAHFVEVFRAGCADAALAASIFHFGIHDIRQLKQELQAASIAVRFPC
jgi:cyclase